MEMIDFVNVGIDTWGHLIPIQIVWVVLAFAGIVAAACYLFPKKVKQFVNKHDVEFERVDGLARVLMELALRLWVSKKGVENTKDLARIKDIARLIDTLYPTNSSIRLSDLIKQLERTTRQSDVRHGTLQEYDETLQEIKYSLLSEVVKVGNQVKDNEHNPLVNTKDLSRWLAGSADEIRRQHP